MAEALQDLITKNAKDNEIDEPDLSMDYPISRGDDVEGTPEDNMVRQQAGDVSLQKHLAQHSSLFHRWPLGSVLHSRAHACTHRSTLAHSYMQTQIHTNTWMTECATC